MPELEPNWNNGTGSFFSTGEPEHKMDDIDPNDLTSRLICYVLIGVFFGFFIAIVLVDMRRKYNSGELQDDIRGIGRAGCSIFKGIGNVFSPSTWSKVFKRNKKTQNDVENAREKQRESQAIIDRLAAKPTDSKNAESKEADNEHTDNKHAGSEPEVAEVSKPTPVTKVVVLPPSPPSPAPEVIITPPSPVVRNDRGYDSSPDEDLRSIYSIEPSAIFYQ